VFEIRNDYLNVTFEKLDIDFDTIESFEMEITLEFYYEAGGEAVAEKLARAYRKAL
jgi:hypothetical protein